MMLIDVMHAAAEPDTRGAFVVDIMLQETFQPIVMAIQSANGLSSLYKVVTGVIRSFFLIHPLSFTLLCRMTSSFSITCSQSWIIDLVIWKRVWRPLL